jgi:hypothetical protein
MSMELDELKVAWQALERRVNADAKLNRELLTELKLRKVRNAVRRLMCLPAIELVLSLFIAAATGRFLFTWFFEPHLAIAGAVLHAAVVAYIATTVRQLALLWGADMSAPVIGIQQTLAEYGALRVRTTKWVLILSPSLWGPLVIVLAKAWLGLDIYRVFGPAWVAVNVGVGVAIVPLLIWVSRKFSHFTQRSLFMQGVTRDIEGRSLKAALKLLDDVKSFARD